VTTVIDLDALKSTELVTLGRGGSVEVREMTGADEKALIDNLVRPARAQPHAFADGLLSRSSGLAAAGVRVLSAAERRRLVSAVVRVNHWGDDWRSLYGSYLSVDERLLAVASWDHRRTHDRLIERLREMRKRNQQKAAAGSAQVDAAVKRAVQARTVGVFAGVSKLQSTFAAMDKISAVLGGYGKVSPGLAVLTGSKTTLGLAIPPSFASAVRTAPTLPALSRVNDSIVGLDHTRNAMETITRGIRTPGLTAASMFNEQLAITKQIVGPHHFAQALGARSARGLADAVRDGVFIGLPTTSFLDQIAKITNPFTQFQGFARWQQQWDWEVIDQFFSSWEDHALWFLFSLLGIGSGAKLAKLSRNEVEPVVFDALEAILADEELSQALATDLSQHPDLTGPHVEQMQMAFEHARAGKYHLAQPYLHTAFESMLYQRALRQGAVKVNEGNFAAAEKLLKRLFTTGDLFLNFTVRLVFGGTGNSYRHGRNEDGHREVTLAGIVALAGYMDATVGTQAVEMIADEMEAQLDAVLEARGLVVAELSQ
jgi:hypothetical protein